MGGKANGFNWLTLVGLALLSAAMLSYAWVGFIGSDDALYVNGAYALFTPEVFSGRHWSFRTPLILPMRGSLEVLGPQVFAIVLPMLVYFAALVATTLWAMRRFANANAAVVAAVVLMTTNLFAIGATIAYIDPVEAFWVLLSFWLFVWAIEEGAPTKLLLLAGAAAGVAFLSRETTVFYLVFLGLLFLAGFGMSRWRYWIMAGGFLAVWVLEALLMTLLFGDPLHRMMQSLGHDSTINRGVDLAGNIIVSPWIDPILVMLLNQEFGLLFWLAIPLMIWANIRAPFDAKTNRLVRLLSVLALTWFLCGALAWKLLPLNPRYFMIPAYAAIMVMAICLVHFWQWGARKTVAAALLGVVGLNVACVYIENKSPLWGEFELARLLRENPNETIHVDPQTYRRIALYLKWNGLLDRVVNRAPEPGSLYLFNPVRVDKPSFLITPEQLPSFQPQPDWSVKARAEPSRRLAGVVLEAIGLKRFVPGGIYSKLDRVHPGITLYSVPAASLPVENQPG
jgi:4-amino-4-deoxy-L-arabinose transferase-like glycosyltransferase